MPLTLYRFPLDSTGLNPDNLVVGEPHTLPNRTVRVLAPLYGAFFTESLVIKDMTSGLTLNASQFKSVELYEFPTGSYGKEICGVILITDTSVSNSIQLTYQALGGEYSMNTDAIIEMLNAINLDNRPVAWPDVQNKPDGFIPAAHYHDVGDVYGFEYLVHAIERLTSAVKSGDDVTHDIIYKYIDDWGAAIISSGSGMTTALSAHTLNTSNPHSTTASQVGLGNVLNYALATTAEAQVGAVTTKYMTPSLTAAAIATQAGALVTAHTNNVNNPHAVTKAQVNLGNVQNFNLATNAEAQAGSVNTAYMTPASTWSAIQAIAVTPLTTHTSRTDNPHTVTKAQIGLSSVNNYALATTPEAQAGTINTAYMTPLSTAAAITTQAGSLITTHTARSDNPHAVTKAQVALGNVLNYALATTAEAQAGSINTAYMTPSLTFAAITQFLANSASQTSRVGDIVFSALSTIPSGEKRILVQGQAVSLTTYATLLPLWCGSTLNNNADLTLRADFFYRCTDAANPSTTRSDTGNFLVLPPAGYFLRGLNTGSTGVDASRSAFKLQADDNLAHTHTTGMPRGDQNYNPGGGNTLWGGNLGAFVYTSNSSGGTEARPKNWPVYVWICY
jgi:hypothetical protein